LMRDNTVLMTRANTTCEGECYKLKMTISETNIRNDTLSIGYFGMDE
jgi:hypothetical protein